MDSQKWYKNWDKLLGITGLVLLGIFLISLLFIEKIGLFWGIIGGLGSILLVIYLIFHGEDIKKILKSRTILYGTNTIVISLAVAAILIFLGIILTRHNLSWDTTHLKFYSLSEQTNQVLKNLKDKVKVTTFYKKGTMQEVQVKDLLKEYKKIAPDKIELEFVDPDQKPGMTNQYNIKEYNVTVLESGTNRKDVTEHEVFTYSYQGYNYGQQPNVEFNGEQAFTSGLLSITGTVQKTIYFMEGHGERNIASANNDREGISQLKTYLEKENYAVRSFNILTQGKIPEDCNVLVIDGPKGPLAEKEVNLVDEYLNKGGKAIILLEPTVDSGLTGFAKEWGIQIDNDFIFDPASCYFFDAASPIPTYKDHEITSLLIKERVGAVFSSVRSVREAAKKKEGETVQVLLETSPQGWGEINFTEKPIKYDAGKDIGGPLPIAVAAQWEIKESTATDKTTSQARLVVFGDSDFTTNKLVPVRGNIDLFLNSVNWLTEQKEKITIRPKSPDIRTIQMSKLQAKTVFYTTVIFIPLGVILAGAIIFWKRRSL